MTKKFNLFSVILSVICVVFVAEAAAPVAALGNSQFFWWIFMFIFFLIPYGLIASELGTTYEGDGGIYDWINKAFPDTKWGARAAWWYWLNFPLWMASLAVFTPDLLEIAFGVSFGWAASLVIQLAFIWIVTLIAFSPISDNILILNVSAAIKVLLALTVGGLGIYFGIKNGFANELTYKSFLPSFDLSSTGFISVIIFNMLGFEIICTYSENMTNPKKQIPEAIIVGGIVIAAIYLISGFGVGAAVEAKNIEADTGLIDALALMTGKEDGILITLFALLFVVTLFGNMISWSMGVNSTAAYAADNGDMPAYFAKRNKETGVPVGAAFLNGIVASVVVILGVLIKFLFPDSSLFWSFFALNLVLFLMSYLPVFPAFLKLRESDPKRERPFKVPGGDVMNVLFTIVPMTLIFIAIIFTVTSDVPILIGSVVCIVIGEILIFIRSRKNGKKNLWNNS